MKKYFYGISFYAKVDMLSWLISSFTDNFTPAQAEFGIFFDACKTDDSPVAFESIRPWWLDQRGYKVHVGQSEAPVREIGCHLALIDMFLKTDCDTLVIFQDDQRLNREIVTAYNQLAEYNGKRLGIVGGRDGFDRSYTNMASSRFSESTAAVKRLEHGECAPKPMLNTGPLIYPRYLLEKGFRPKADMHAFYVHEEFSASALKAGFSNYVMGMDITHVKFGRVVATNWYLPEIAARDLAIFKQAHPDMV